jgi:polyhydroxyalkanoate synthase
MRRWQGAWLDVLGWGPVQSPWRVVLKEPVLTLRAYANTEDKGPAVLIVPAPIKGGTIWDLLPRASAVQEFVRSGFRVYLMHWEKPGVTEQELGLEAYAERLILRSLQAIEQETGQGRVFLAGHSLGGTFAAIFATLHPESVAGLILLGTPLHFGTNRDVFSPWVAASPSAPVLTGLLGTVSGSFLNMVSLLASPQAFAFGRWEDWLASLGDAPALETHLKVERWTYEEMPMPRRLFEEVVEWLYREDRFMRGMLELGQRRAAPERLEAPLLIAVERRSAVAPPESVLPFYHAVHSTEKRLLWYEGDKGVALQHVGVLVGKLAHQTLWPIIVRWALHAK